MRENPSFLERVDILRDVVCFGWNVAKFNREVDYKRRDFQLGKAVTLLAAKVEAGNVDFIAAEDEMNRLSRPQTIHEAMLTDRRAEKASIRLSRLVESGFIDSVRAGDILDSGLNTYIVKKVLDESKRAAS